MQVLDWTRREEALEPAGVVAAGPVALRLIEQLRARNSEEAPQLSVVATRDMLVLLGAGADLPWADGVRYCAPDPAAQTMWVPTHLTPVLPVDLIRRSLARRAGSQAILLWNEPEQVIALDQQGSLSPALLDWLAGALR